MKSTDPRRKLIQLAMTHRDGDFYMGSMAIARLMSIFGLEYGEPGLDHRITLVNDDILNKALGYCAPYLLNMIQSDNSTTSVDDRIRQLSRRMTEVGRDILDQLTSMERNILMANDDLKTVLKDAVDELHADATEMETLVNKLADAKASGDDAELTSLISELKDATAASKAKVESLAEHPALATPAPAPGASDTVAGATGSGGTPAP